MASVRRSTMQWLFLPLVLAASAGCLPKKKGEEAATTTQDATTTPEVATTPADANPPPPVEESPLSSSNAPPPPVSQDHGSSSGSDAADGSAPWESGHFPANGFFAQRSIAPVEAGAADFINSNLDTAGGTFIQAFNVSANGERLYLTVSPQGAYQVVYYVNTTLGYLNPESGELLFCGDYRRTGHNISMPLLSCVPFLRLDAVAANATYPDGSIIRSGSTFFHDAGAVLYDGALWSYANGGALRHSDGTVQWPTGSTARFTDNTFAYADGVRLRDAGSTLFHHSGNVFGDANPGSTRYLDGSAMSSAAGDLYYDGGSSLFLPSGDIFYADGARLRQAGVLYRSGGSVAPFAIMTSQAQVNGMAIVEAWDKKYFFGIVERSGSASFAAVHIRSYIPKPPVPLPYADDFNRTDAGDLGGQWEQQTGAFRLAGNKAANVTNGFVAAITNAYRDTEISADVTIGSGASDAVGLALRYSGGGDVNHHEARLMRDGGTLKFVLANNYVPAWVLWGGAPATSGKMTFREYKGNMKLFFNNQLLLSGGVSTWGSGIGGFRLFGTATVDNVSIREIADQGGVAAAFPYAGTFDGAKGHLGDEWTTWLGAFYVTNSAANHYGVNWSFATLNGINKQDTTIEADITLATGRNNSAGILTRYQGNGLDTNYYRALLQSRNGVPYVTLHRMLNGGAVQLAEAQVPAAAGRVRLDVVGTRLTVYFNGTTLYGVNDSLIAGAGSAGIWSYSLAPGVIDNVSVSDPKGAPTGGYSLPLPGSKFASVYGSSWQFDTDGNGGAVERTILYGGATDQQVVGDWDGAGPDRMAVFRNGTWYLDLANNGGNGEREVVFGTAGDRPVVGDWNGDGTDDLGVWRAGLWSFDQDGRGGAVELSYPFGLGTDVPVVGDFNGDGRDEPGVFRAGTWFIDLGFDGGAGEQSLTFGAAGVTPIVGDWDNDGRDNLGYFANGIWYLDMDGQGGQPEITVAFGRTAGRPLTGRW